MPSLTVSRRPQKPEKIMDIKECKDKKAELESNILGLVAAYEKETGCRVDRLLISTYTSEQSDGYRAIGITATVEL